VKRPPTKSRTSQRSTTPTLILIALFKLVKAIMLIAVGVGAVDLLHKDVAQTVAHWVNVLRVDPDNRFIHRIVARIFNVTPGQLKAVSAGTFFYAALLSTEGIGLLLRKHWAEYFTVITTAALIPLEVYELIRHLTVAKVAVLIINIAIVWYLVLRLRKPHAKPKGFR
jgi:uncharacterized membrane protein (DUF2068 family)